MINNISDPDLNFKYKVRIRINIISDPDPKPRSVQNLLYSYKWLGLLLSLIFRIIENWKITKSTQISDLCTNFSL